MGTVDSSKEAIARRITERRIKLGWSQLDLASAYGTTQSMVSAVESSGVSTLSAIQRWAKALQCNPVWLAYGKGKQEQEQ